MTNVEALKALYVALGGEAADVADAVTSVEVLNAIAAKYDGVDDAVINPDAIEAIAAVAGNIGGGGAGGDFSVAHVTFSSSNGNPYTIVLAYLTDDGVKVESQMFNSAYTMDIPLYDGKCLLSVYNSASTDSSVMPVVTGNVTFDSGCFVITGDGTIAFAGAA